MDDILRSLTIDPDVRFWLQEQKDIDPLAKVLWEDIAKTAKKQPLFTIEELQGILDTQEVKRVAVNFSLNFQMKLNTLLHMSYEEPYCEAS